MVQFIKQKIVRQKWLSLCLTLGISLLIATISCQPMFKEGSLNKLIQQMLLDSLQEHNEYPVVVGKSGSYETDETTTAQQILDMLATNQKEWEKSISYLPVVNSQTKLTIPEKVGVGSCATKGKPLEVTFVPGIEDHIQILKGEGFESQADADAGKFHCILSEKSMDKNNLVVGEKIRFENLRDAQGNHLEIVVSGIFKEKDREDLFWYEGPNDDEKDIYVSQALYDEILRRYEVKVTLIDHVVLFDYETLNGSMVDSLLTSVNRFAKKDDSFYITFGEILLDFVSRRSAVSVMLWVLELPILGMVLAFIYMVSGQIVESEQAEISTLKSRGFSRLFILWIYFARALVIAAFSLLIGIPMGYGLCKISASTTDFLTFDGMNMGLYRFVPSMLLYGFLAVFIAVLCVLLPVISRSNISIVEQKSNKHKNGKMLWERFYLDILLLILAVYLLYNFNQSLDQLRAKALYGSKLDPMIFLNTCLFMIAFGMFIFRLIHHLVKLVYRLGRKHWNPVSYTAFLQITRTFRKQTFVTVFMILTVSFGLFNANTARTINRNYEDRIYYTMGTDVIFQEKWEAKSYQDEKRDLKLRYIEPDYSKYQSLVEQGLCEHITKVMRYANTDAFTRSKVLNNVLVLGIDTKQFGETAFLKDSLNKEEHWFNKLNALAQKTNGVIISTNMAKAMELKVGDYVSVRGITYGKPDQEKEMSAKVVAITDVWPGYDRYYYKNGEEKERYLMVMNMAALIQKFEITPYEIWVDLKDEVTSQQVHDYLVEQQIPISSFDSISQQVQTMKASPEIQITNGMFTLSFLIALVLCSVGFLIYWITSLKQRELLMGVYRAMGLSVKSINQMLLYEHFFSTFLSVIAGGIVGGVTTLLFIRLFGVVYLPQKSNLDIYIYYEPADIMKLFATIVCMIIVCLIILRGQIKRMNITQALKLGED